MQLLRHDKDDEQSSPLSRITRLFGAFHHRLAGWGNRLTSLNFSQKCYLIAVMILLLASNDVDSESALLWAGVPALIGLSREFWFVFNSLWGHTLGKGLLLVLYAATANFAIAISALKINEVAGIEPTPFVFTLGFTTLLMLPFWLVIATVVFFSVALVLINLWLLVSLLLRLIRVKVQVHWEDKSFVFVTMLMRLVLIPVVINALLQVIEPYSHQVELFNEQIQFYDDDKFSEEELSRIQNAEPGQVSDIIAAIKAERAEAGLEPIDDAGETKPYLNIMIGNFIYWFETYPYSGCQKTSEQRTLVIDENSMFVAQKAENELGYTFSVMPCDPAYPAPPVEIDTPETPDKPETKSSEQGQADTIQPDNN